MDTTLDLDGYLRRIGYDGVPRADLATLRGLAVRHADAIPFENLDPLLGEPPRLDVPSLERKLVAGGRGGYCFEQNALFAAVLEQLGLRVTRLAARVLWGRWADAVAPRTHMLLKVDLDGGPVIADVGFGGLTLTGTLSLTPNIEQPTPHEPFRLVPLDDGWRMEAFVRGEWAPLYRFDLQQQHPVDYEAANWYLSTWPGSYFVNNLMAARATREGRLAILNREYTVHPRHGDTQRRTLQNADELMAVLERDFAIALPARDAARSRLSRLFG